jgi:dihydroorotase-like cyclic amidohydrolase
VSTSPIVPALPFTTTNEPSAGSTAPVSTDHAPSTLQQKRAGSIWDVHFGLPGLDTTSAILVDGALNGRLSLERLVQVYAAAPARAYGLAGKGSLEPGSDADFVLIDPLLKRTLTGAEVRSKAGWTPFEGRKVRGRILATYLRGELIVAGGTPIEPKSGNFVARS